MTRIAVVLTNGFSDWECGLLMAAARSYYGLEVVTVSADGEGVVSAGGLKVTPDQALGDLDAGEIDALVLNGGPAWTPNVPEDVIRLVRTVQARRKPVGAICGAVQALAAAGVLNDVAHTGNALAELSAVSGYEGSGRFIAQPDAVSDGGVVTAAGTAPVTFMKKMMEALGLGSSDLDFYVGMHAAEHKAA